jgi:probable H4MPT-linked C1 transfer pathway protein
MVFGVDIGGANIKITQLDGLKVRSTLLPFVGKGDLIEKLIYSVTDPDLVVLTQTMCARRKLFSSSKEGTHYIIDMTHRLFGDRVKYLGLSYTLYGADEAKKKYLDVAGRNWVGTCYLVSYLGIGEDCLVIDCGTNSTDVVPVLHNNPVTIDDEDKEYTRLKTGELLWSGLFFTPVLSLSNTIVLDGEEYAVKPTTDVMTYHVYIALGIISPEEIAAKYSGWRTEMRRVSFQSSVEKMLDVISADRELLTPKDAEKIAKFLAEKQKKNTEKAVKKVLSAVKLKYGINLDTAAIAGAGKNVILLDVLKNLNFEVVDIEKAASESFDMEDAQTNCETSLGCALRGSAGP